MSYYDSLRDVTVLKGQVLKDVRVGDFEIFFDTEDGKSYKMYHEQECCESVWVEDVVGDVRDLVGSVIVEASEESNCESYGEYGDSQTWTFYKLGTRKGSVTIRWCGQSNGYYSEGVSFVEV